MGTVLSTSPTSLTVGKRQSSRFSVNREMTLLNRLSVNDQQLHANSVISLPSEEMYHVTQPSNSFSLSASLAASSTSLTDVLDWTPRRRLDNILKMRPTIADMTTREKLKNSLSKLFSRFSWLKLHQSGSNWIRPNQTGSNWIRPEQTGSNWMVFNDAHNNNNTNVANRPPVPPLTTTTTYSESDNNRSIGTVHSAGDRSKSLSSSDSLTASDIDLSASREFIIATDERVRQCSRKTTGRRFSNQTDSNFNPVVLDNYLVMDSSPTKKFSKDNKHQLLYTPQLIDRHQRLIYTPSQITNATHTHPGHTIVQASTSDLLFCLGEFLRHRCRHVIDLRASDVSTWLRDVDASLISYGWQETPFVNPANVVFVFLLVRAELAFFNEDDDDFSESSTLLRIRPLPSDKRSTIGSASELKAICLTCLYLAYSYMGSEISYPLRQFLGASNTGCPARNGADIGALRGRFWSRCLRIVAGQSYFMLRINKDPGYFAEVFADLISYSVVY